MKISTPFGPAKYIGTIGVNLREDSIGVFTVRTGEYLILWRH